MVLTTPVEMHTTLSAKNAYALVHARICNSAEASLPWKLLRPYLESCASIVQAVVCHPLLPPLLLSRPKPSPDAVRSRNPSKSTLAHDAVTAVVSHKHHSIFRVGAGLILFVYGSHSRLATELTHYRNLFSPFFARDFSPCFQRGQSQYLLGISEHFYRENEKFCEVECIEVEKHRVNLISAPELMV